MSLRRIMGVAVVGLCLVSSGYSDEPGPPKVAVVWAAGPMEVRVAFDRTVDPGIVNGLIGATIRMDEASPFVGAPRHPVAQRTFDGPRIAAAKLVDEGRTLILATDPHTRPAVYTLTLPPLSGGKGEPTNVPYDLNGIELSWDSGGINARPEWSSWWPSFQVRTWQYLRLWSVEHERVMTLLERPGRLTLRTLVSLPAGKSSLSVLTDCPVVEASLAGENATLEHPSAGVTLAKFPNELTGDVVDLNLVLKTGSRTGKAQPMIQVNYQKASDPVTRVFSHREFSVPWLPPVPPPPVSAPSPPDFSGGDVRQGEMVFFGEAAKCASCHEVRGKGGKVGPDLSTVGARPTAEVYRDVAEPSAFIRPDYVPYTVATKDGRVLAGIVRAEGADAIRLTDTEAKATLIPRTEIEELRPSATSVMPVGLVGAIGEAKVRDLMAYLMSLKP